MKSTKYFFTSVFFMFLAVMSHFIRYYQVLMCAIYRNNIEVISLSEALAAQYAYYITLGLGIAFFITAWIVWFVSDRKFCKKIRNTRDRTET